MQLEGEFADFRTARLLPRELLHAKLADAVWRAFMRGEFDSAVLHAMKAVEVSVRDAAGLAKADIRYNKSRYTCAEPNHLPHCPLPNHWLRNGRLNQTAFSLFLFIRDVAGGDLVGWIDRRLHMAARHPGPDRLENMRMALLEPLKEIYGVSDKVLSLALSILFLGASGHRRRWREVGGSMIVIDRRQLPLDRTDLLARQSALAPAVKTRTYQTAPPRTLGHDAWAKFHLCPPQPHH
jgi:hypothetical protein